MKASLNVNTLEYTDSTGVVHNLEGRLEMSVKKVNEQTKPIDYFGKVIKVGDIVSYPVRHGSTMTVESGTTVGFEVKPGYDHFLGYNKEVCVLLVQKPGTTKFVKVTRLDRVVVTPDQPPFLEPFFKDFLGNNVNVGDFVAFPTQRGHTTYQTVGKVVKFYGNGDKILVERVLISGNKLDPDFDVKPKVVVSRVDSIVRVDPKNLDY